MLRYYGTVAVADEISDAANGVIEGYASGRSMDESDITAKMAGAIKERIKNRTINGVKWDSHSLTSSGKDAEEKRYGADLMGVLDISLTDYNTKKGFLMQAKKAEPDVRFRERNWKILVSQCERMLDITPDSFVFVYSRSKSVSKRIRIFRPARFSVRDREIYSICITVA